MGDVSGSESHDWNLCSFSILRYQHILTYWPVLLAIIHVQWNMLNRLLKICASQWAAEGVELDGHWEVCSAQLASEKIGSMASPKYIQSSTGSQKCNQLNRLSKNDMRLQTMSGSGCARCLMKGSKF